MSRTFSAGMQSLLAAATKRFVSLLEIETATGTLRYVDTTTNFTFDGNTYYSKSFIYPFAKFNNTLSFDDTPVTVANLDQALDSGIFIDDLRGRSVVIKQVVLNSVGAPGGTGTEYIDQVDGYVESVQHTEVAAVLQVRSRMAFADRIVPQRSFGSSCPWLFGSTNCGYDKDATALTAQTADAGSTTTSLADAARTEADDYWKDGMVTFTSGDLSGERRRVHTSTSGTITLEHAFSAAPDAADEYSITQGCDRQYSTCQDRFSNEDNFGGFVSFPRGSMFE